MFCRFCGSDIPPESSFCLKCGQQLVSSAPSPRWDAVSRKLRLKTPYPYAVVLFLAFVVWAVQPRHRVDYSNVSFTLELEGQASIPEDNLFRHSLSLVIENIGADSISEVPIEFTARLDRDQPVEVVSDFFGRQLIILKDKQTLPLVVVLSGELASGEKRRYAVDGIVTTRPPASIIYEVFGEDLDEVLASLSMEIQSSSASQSGPVAGIFP